jgi:hypothetical protein
MGEVPATNTPASSDEIRMALDLAWPELSPRARDYFHGLVLVETGNGKALKQWNVGNLSAGGFYSGSEKLVYPTYWRPPWFSGTGELHDRMIAGKAPSAFRAYSSLEQGVSAYVGLLRSRQYQALVVAADLDDVSGFVQALHDSGYSSDYGPKHVPTFSSIIRDIRGTYATHMQVATPQSSHLGASTVLMVGGVLLLTGAVFWGKIKPRNGSLSR